MAQVEDPAPVEPEPPAAQQEPAPQTEPAPPAPAFDYAAYSGVWRGTRKGRPLALEITLSASGKVSGRCQVTVGSKVSATKLVGTWSQANGGVVLTLDEPNGPKPVHYEGTGTPNAISGRVTIGKAEGTWSAAR